jgi:hypothetical protein
MDNISIKDTIQETNTKLKEDDKICMACYTEIRDNETISKLKCGHNFHYECIFYTYKNNLENKINTGIRRCPYCREDGGFLKLNSHTIPIAGIHEDYNRFINYIIEGRRDKYIDFLNKDKCLAILKSGDNKGLQCKFNPSNGDFCKRHNKIL